MKKYFLLAAVLFFLFFGGFGSGSRGWALALKKFPTIRHIYTDFDNVPISRHYVRVVIGYDARANLLLFWQKIH